MVRLTRARRNPMPWCMFKACHAKLLIVLALIPLLSSCGLPELLGRTLQRTSQSLGGLR